MSSCEFRNLPGPSVRPHPVERVASESGREIYIHLESRLTDRSHRQPAPCIRNARRANPASRRIRFSFLDGFCPGPPFHRRRHRARHIARIESLNNRALPNPSRRSPDRSRLRCSARSSATRTAQRKGRPHRRLAFYTQRSGRRTRGVVQRQLRAREVRVDGAAARQINTDGRCSRRHVNLNPFGARLA